MTSGSDGSATKLTARLLGLKLGDPSRVTPATCLVSGGLRLLFLPLYVSLDVYWLGFQSTLALLLYLVLIAYRRRPTLVLLALGPEWLLWSYSNTVTFGGGCSFQLYPLFLLPAFVLSFHFLSSGFRFVLLTAPLLLYVPFFSFFGDTPPLVELAEHTRNRLAAANELVVALVTALFTGVALLQQWQARRLAEQREMTQAQLIEDLAHELRTPLATLLTATQGAKAARERPQRVAESLDWIEGAARSTGRLVDRLLDLASPDDAVPAGSPAELGVIVKASLERLRPVAEQRGVSLVLREVSACHETVDSASLEIVLRNIVSNAIAHSPRGERVEIRILRDLGCPRLEVEDRGEGIAPEHLTKVFDRLWRADPARSRREGRYGLGLTIARRHAASLGASIEVTSEVGRGSVFSVVFGA